MSDFTARFVIAFLQLAATLPRGMRAALAQLGGALLWLTGSRSRKTTETNLALCFPNLSAAERQSLAKQSLIETVRLGLEMGPAWLWSADRSLAMIDHVEGREHMEAARAAGRGIVILAPHIGNWELLGLWLGRHYQAINLYQPPKSPLLDKLIHDARSRSGAQLVPTDKKGVATLLKGLKNGGVTGILPDQEPETSGGVFAPFFGVPALTATLAANLARKTNAVVLAAYVKRTADGYVLVIDPVDESVVDGDEVIAATAVNRAVENCVKAAPAQYQWEYKRFKARNDRGGKRYRD
jgi:KDO2-lipid IV(A) lauroyltransferase